MPTCDTEPRPLCSSSAPLWLCLLFATAAFSGCYKATFIAPRTAAGVEHDEWTDFFLFGLAGDESYDAHEACEGGVARVRTGGNVATGVVSVLTIGIYTPRKVYVTCADPVASQAIAAEHGSTP